MTQRDPKVRLLHMRDYARKAIDMSSGRERKDLDDDEMFQLALTRLVEMIGEAASGLPIQERNEYPHIPWPKIMGMRHRLIHEYDNVDLDILWDTLRYDFLPCWRNLKKL